MSGRQDSPQSAAPKPDIEIALSWLRTLFGQCDTGWVTLLSIPRRGRRVETAWRTVSDLDSFADFIEVKGPDDNVYVGMATRRERLDGGKRGD